MSPFRRSFPYAPVVTEMSSASIALNRFGLGHRDGDAVPRDPSQWLLDQIDTFKGAPPGFPSAFTDTAAVTDAASFVSRSLRGLNGNGAVSPGTAGNSMPMPRTKIELRSIINRNYAENVALRAKLAVESATPFMERIVHFWSNHFAISLGKDQLKTLSGFHEFGAIRQNMSGSFRELLIAAALHPAMLIYLDQHRSVGPNSMVAKRRRNRSGKVAGLNENLGREILELHTLGVNGGYSQADVTELARALTGWTVAGLPGGSRGEPQPQGANFRTEVHEPGTRTILGRAYAAEGPAQALAILDDLSVHPATARFISTKLARHFAGDNPPQSMVARLERAFLQSDGDLPTLYRAIVNSPEAWVEGPIKYRQPWEWFVATLRATSPDLLNSRQIANTLRELGQQVWNPGSPDGFGDTQATWLSGDGLMRRVLFAEELAKKAALSDVRELARTMFPGSLSNATEQQVRQAESNEMALALLFVSPEMLRR